MFHPTLSFKHPCCPTWCSPKHCKIHLVMDDTGHIVSAIYWALLCARCRMGVLRRTPPGRQDSPNPHAERGGLLAEGQAPALGSGCPLSAQGTSGLSGHPGRRQHTAGWAGKGVHGLTPMSGGMEAAPVITAPSRPAGRCLSVWTQRERGGLVLAFPFRQSVPSSLVGVSVLHVILLGVCDMELPWV